MSTPTERSIEDAHIRTSSSFAAVHALGLLKEKPMSYLIDNLFPKGNMYHVDDRHFLWKCATFLIFQAVLWTALAGVTFLLWLLIAANG